MKITVAAVGKLKAGPERELFERYTARIGPAGKPVGLGPLSTVEINESRHRNVADRKAEEADRLSARINADAVIVVLDERGETVTSAGLAKLLEKERNRGAGEMVFVIGGPDGHGEDMRIKANSLLALGPMTLAHGLVRIVLAEQIYRAITILTGHPYHRA